VHPERSGKYAALHAVGVPATLIDLAGGPPLVTEEAFDKYDKMVIAGLHREYFGSLLFSRGGMSQYEFVARAVAELTGAQQGTREYEELVAKLTKSVKKLSEWGVLDVKEYEARLTAWGQSLASSISAEEFEKIRQELAKEAAGRRRR